MDRNVTGIRSELQGPGRILTTWRVPASEIGTTETAVTIYLNQELMSDRFYWLVFDKTTSTSDYYEIQIRDERRSEFHIMQSSDGSVWEWTDLDLYFFQIFSWEEAEVKVGDVAQSDAKEIVFTDNMFLDEEQAKMVARRLLMKYGSPFYQAELEVYASDNLWRPGYRVVVSSDKLNIMRSYVIHEVTYSIESFKDSYTCKLTLASSDPPETLEDMLARKDRQIWDAQLGRRRVEVVSEELAKMFAEEITLSDEVEVTVS